MSNLDRAPLHRKEASVCVGGTNRPGRPERFRAALPTQSLALLNNPLVMRTSKAFTERVVEESKGDYEAAVTLAFQEAYNRPPTAREQEIAKQSIAAEQDFLKAIELDPKSVPARLAIGNFYVQQKRWKEADVFS